MINNQQVGGKRNGRKTSTPNTRQIQNCNMVKQQESELSKVLKNNSFQQKIATKNSFQLSQFHDDQTDNLTVITEEKPRVCNF